MCLRKKKIYSPVKSENRLSISKINIDIPCGTCKQCRQQRQNDWLVRSYFEFISKPQEAFFITLDFDEQHVPLWNTLSHQPGSVQDRYRYLEKCFDYQAIPEDLICCFDHEIITRFIDSLRNGLPNCPFRYLIATDSGSINDRPHYHGVFLFDKGSIDPLVFFQKIAYYWHYGRHTNIQSIATKYKNPFKALEYVCNYSVKDTDFDKIRKRESLPGRFSSRVLPSIGWGAQALDPTEFPSDRLIKQGIMFLDRPVLTRNYLKNNSQVFIDIKNDGVLVPFHIPRYYELKLMYDWRWNSETKREEAHINLDGIDLARLRHNRDYEYYYSVFKLSRNRPIFNDLVKKTFYRYYPSSVYAHVKWSEIVDDVLLDGESFYEFCKIKPFLEYTMPQYSPYGRLIKDSVGIGRYRPLKFFSKVYNTDGSVPTWSYYRAASQSEDLKDLFSFFPAEDLDRYIEACFIFDCYNYMINDRVASYYDWQAIEKAKEKARHKIAEDPKLFWHLKRHNFNFSKLTYQSYSYVSHN